MFSAAVIELQIIKLVYGYHHCGYNHDSVVSLDTSLLMNYKTKMGGTGSFSDTEFCPLSAVMGGDLNLGLIT